MRGWTAAFADLLAIRYCRTIDFVDFHSWVYSLMIFFDFLCCSLMLVDFLWCSAMLFVCISMFSIAFYGRLAWPKIPVSFVRIVTTNGSQRLLIASNAYSLHSFTTYTTINNPHSLNAFLLTRVAAPKSGISTLYFPDLGAANLVSKNPFEVGRLLLKLLIKCYE